MAFEVLMPQLGLTMEEGTVSKWLKHEGDAVKVGDALLEITTDKLTNEVISEHEGVLLKIVAQEEQDVPVKGLLAYIGQPGEAVGGAAPAAPAAPAAAAPAAKSAEDTSVLVIGGGPGGYVAAIRAAQLGAKVTLVEKAEMGGTCLNRGCMPTKALLHSAEIYELATKSEEAGIIGKEVLVDWAKVQQNRANVTLKLTSGVSALMKANKIKVLSGEAVFTGPKTVKVGAESITADKIIIAAGSYPIIPGIPGVKESKACIDSTGALTLDHIPESLAVIGGGVIGIELGSVYAAFGTKVTIIEMLPKLLPLMEGELTGMVRKQLEDKGIAIYTETKVLSVSDTANGAIVKAESKDGVHEFAAEKVLVCVGRGPATANLGLAKAGIAEDHGYIQANDRMETNVEGVYAIGDCNGKLQLAHAAMAMGEVAAENALGGNRTFRAEESPSCVYVGPEFAGVGLTEEKAQELGLKYKVGRFPTSGNGKSLVMGHTDGMIKVLAGEEYGEILGVHILAAHATDLIEEAALAIKLEATVDELIETIHCHPTVAEALREGVLAADGRAIHVPNKKKK
ncbi:MAG: dihydrolipoyl dehydrogenase [Candidatus Limivicinus sp.]